MVRTGFFLAPLLCGAAGYKPHVCSAPLDGEEGRPSENILAEYEITQVQVVTRHGARSPYHSIPNVSNPHHFICQLHGEEAEVASRWPELFRVHDRTDVPVVPQPPLHLGTESDGVTCQLGGLLMEGVKQTRAIGVHLREAYGEFLANLAPSQLYARTETIPRVVISTVSLLSGLLLGRQGDIQPAAQQYPIYIIEPDSQEPMNGLPCAAGSAFKTKADKEYRYPESVAKRLGHLFGLQDFGPYLKTVDPAIADVTYTALCDGGNFPCGPGGCVDAVLQHELDGLYDKKWTSQFGQGDGLKGSKLLMYPLIKEVFSFMTSESRPRFVLFTGRDLVIGPVASALGFFDNQWPPFASHIVFELWQPKGAGSNAKSNLRVRVLFDGVVVSSKFGCKSELCPLEAFHAVVEGLLDGHSSHTEACAQEVTSTLGVMPEQNGALLLAAASLAALLAFLLRAARPPVPSIEETYRPLL